MDYIGIEEVAKKWGLSKRFVQVLCANGRIEGATRLGRAWMIPKNAKNTIDGRMKAARAENEADMPLPRKTPFLYMSDLYNTPGTADEVGESLSYNREAQVLFEAEVAYSRGEIDRVYDIANYLLGKHSGFYAVLSAGMLLAQCAIWKGDINMWRKAKVHIAEAPAKSDLDKKGVAISGTRKAKIQSYVNSLQLKAVEKYMIMGYLGYKNTKGEIQVKAYINRLSLTKTEKAKLLEYSGYAS